MNDILENYRLDRAREIHEAAVRLQDSIARFSPESSIAPESNPSRVERHKSLLSVARLLSRESTQLLAAVLQDIDRAKGLR